MEILSFFGGVLYYYSRSWLALLFVISLISFRPSIRLCLAACLGGLLGVGHDGWICDHGMPQQPVIRHAILTGKIATIPKQRADKTQFDCDLQTMNTHPVQARIQLNCYRDCPSLHTGQTVTLRAKLHEVHNLNNPGGFDYKTYLAARHIHWVGSVQQGSIKVLSQPLSKWNIGVMREKLANHLAHLFSDETSLGIVQALTIGLSTHISQASWALFRCTGTTHLMVISGAHIGLVAGMIFKLICGLWSRCQWLCLRYPAQRVASIVAILLSIAYAVLAGFGAPAERATICAGLVFFRYLGQRQFSAWQSWRYALCLVLVTEPHSVLLPGFYLSFMAVAVLLAMNRRLRSQNILKAIGIQLSCMLGLLPFTWYWFSYGSVTGLFANLVAIPWVSFVMVPLAFLCLLVGQYLIWLPKILHHSIQFLLIFLQWMQGLEWMNLQRSYPSVVLPIAGVVALILWVFLPIRALISTAITLLTVAMYPNHPQIPNQTFKAQILDVGQGLAVLILTHSHALLYDSGGKNYQGSDMGKEVILPYFKYIGLNYLDKIVISHPDLDHRGGLGSIQAIFPSAELVVDNPQFYHRGVSCHHYAEWIWDGVRFKFFPINQNLGSTNNHSCVLQVANAGGQILLSGDIETAAEHVLTQNYGPQLQSTVLVIPHHGSKTSSSLEFLRVIAPDYAIFSYGFDNRYHFPHAKILKRYHALHIATAATSEQGMISLVFGLRPHDWKVQ